MSEENYKTLKRIGEIFSDYKGTSNIKYATVNGLDVIKKTNTLEVYLYFDEYIEVIGLVGL